jgi:hypothetical protein
MNFLFNLGGHPVKLRENKAIDNSASRRPSRTNLVFVEHLAQRPVNFLTKNFLTPLSWIEADHLIIGARAIHQFIDVDQKLLAWAFFAIQTGASSRDLIAYFRFAKILRGARLHSLQRFVCKFERNLALLLA